MSMGSNFNKYLRTVVRSMYKDGEIVEAEHIAGYSVSNDVKTLLKLIVQLVMGGYFKEESKQVLLGVSYRNSGNAMDNVNTVKSRVAYDYVKLSRILGIDFFETILNKQESDLSSYTTKINQLLESNTKSSVLDMITIKLPEHSGNEIDYICQEDWMFLLGAFAWYSKQSVQRTEKQLTGDMVDYVKYLECHADGLNEIQQKHYDILQGFK